MRLMNSLSVVCGCLVALTLSGQSNSADPALFAKAKAATVVILTGEGAGRLHGFGSGILVRSDGTILTALHVIKGATEVQVRLSDGNLYDHVELLGSDERRDIAALKIAATRLPFLSPSAQTEQTIGESVFAVTHASGLSFSATEGILSAIRPAAEIPGAGSGFTLLQFTAPIAPGASGSALLDRSANVIGIITSGMANAGFAVPVNSVLGLVESGQRTTLGSGAALQLPAQQQANSSQSSAAVADLHPKDLLKRARTIYLHSKTSFLTIDTLQRAMLLQKDWPGAGLTIINDPRLADVAVEIDRPLFTYVHTWVLTDRSSSVVLGAGKVTALDGTIASGDIAKQILKLFRDAHAPAVKP